jgi:hypothetical protein
MISIRTNTYILFDKLNYITGLNTTKHICKKCNKKWCLIPSTISSTKPLAKSCLHLSEQQPRFCTDCVSDEDTVSEISEDENKQDNTITLSSPKKSSETDSTIKSTAKLINVNSTNLSKDTLDTSTHKLPATQKKRKIDNEITILPTEEIVSKIQKVFKYDSKTSLSRYYKERTDDSSYAIYIPTTKVQHITTLIKKHLNIDTENVKSYIFSNTNQAKEYFGRKFGYITNKNENFFKFYLPPYLENINEYQVKDTCNLDLFYSSIETLYNEAWLNDDIIDFVLQCLNIVTYYCSDLQETPPVIFGSTQDCTRIVPSESMYSKVYEYLNTSVSNSDEYQLLKSESIELMKNWYCQESKNYLSMILDIYKKKSKIITKYANVVNVDNNHWLFIEVNLDNSTQKNAFGTIQLIDSLGDTVSPTKSHLIRFFSKFFGLYKKESSGYHLSDKDFDLKETETYTSSICASGNTSAKTPTKLSDNSPSYLKEISNNTSVLQTDGFNCGIHALLQCKKILSISSKQQPEDVNLYRLNIMSLASTLFDMYYKEIYDFHFDHLFMSTDHDFTVGTFFKWQHIHNLFNNEDIKYSLLGNVNANSVFDQYTLKQLQKKFPETELKSVVSESRSKKKEKSSLVKSDVKKCSLKSMDLVDMIHTRTDTVFDISNLNLILGLKVREPNEVCKVQTPKQTVQELLDLYFDSYKKVEQDDTQLKKFRRQLKVTMRNFENFVLFDVIDKDHYDIICALTFEREVYVDNVKCSIIHLLATKKGHHRTMYSSMLLHEIFKSSEVRNNKVYFVKRFGYQVNNLFSEMTENVNFKSITCEALENLLPKNSKAMVTSGSNIFYATTGNDHDSFNYDSTPRICVLSNQLKIRYRYYNGKMQMYSNSFGWTTTNDDDNKLLTYVSVQKAKKNPNEEFTMRGGGSRNESESSLLLESQKKEEIESNFQQSTYATENNCVWLAAAMLVKIYDEGNSDIMINELKKNPNRFEWIYFTKIPKTEMDDPTYTPTETMIQLLQKIVKYQLVKVRKEKDFLDFVLREDTQGLYLCMLETKSGSKSHVIGIDCFNKTIYDCMEKFGLVLNKENIDYCCGQGSFGLQSICSCFIVQKQS